VHTCVLRVQVTLKPANVDTHLHSYTHLPTYLPTPPHTHTQQGVCVPHPSSPVVEASSTPVHVVVVVVVVVLLLSEEEEEEGEQLA